MLLLLLLFGCLLFVAAMRNNYVLVHKTELGYLLLEEKRSVSRASGGRGRTYALSHAQ